MDISQSITSIADTFHQQIADALDGEEFGEEVEGTLDYHEKIVRAMSRLRSAMSTRATVSSIVLEANQSGHAGTSDKSSHSMEAARSDTTGQTLVNLSRPHAPSLQVVALPKLQVLVFNGENREWRGFWEHYKAPNHTHAGLTGIEMLKYLKTYLSGTAKRVIEGIRLIEANHSIAVKVLIERFDRKDILIDDHIDSLLAIVPIE
ncbi:hypothetical protein HPB51_001315 [Rhipicephalus microplus]|uniref:Uncharacterized protein n=1 Tax=Rhipicephalus microplus TaxID=6941 RepID=A0A9J6DZ60_RHIMP|nr:hypothetical protein HPB51_001315 [Rhipicephalus microplus]